MAPGFGYGSKSYTRFECVASIVRITMPYRLARLFGRSAGFRWLGELTFLDDTEFDPEPIQLSLAQVEWHGPGLMVDYRHPTGGQFIAWVE